MIATSNLHNGSLPPMPESPEEYCAREVRQHDPDRWLTALFAPDSGRPGLLALYAFNSEIARAREAVSEPMIGQIRLQWWRESWEGIFTDKPRQHPVILALHHHCRTADAGDVMALIDGRERDMDPSPIANMTELLSYARDTSVPLMRLAAQHLGALQVTEMDHVLAGAGTAYALVGLLRATPYLAAQQRVCLPADRLGAAGLTPAAVYQQPAGGALHGVIGAVGEQALSLLNRLHGPRYPRSLLPAILPAVLGRLYLERLLRAGWDPQSPQAGVSATRKHVALLSAMVTRRL